MTITASTENNARRSDATRLEVVLMGMATAAMGLIAGFFYAYACSVMIGLGRTDDRTFITSMQWINATVRNAGFAPSFFGALVLSATAAVVTTRRSHPGHRLVITAACLYAAAFAITMTINVPLNNRLAAAGLPDDSARLTAIRDNFENTWVFWNLIRATLSTIALVALISAISRKATKFPDRRSKPAANR
jgi:uncharacterized membrane protein